MSVFSGHKNSSYGRCFNSTIGGAFFLCPFFTDLCIYPVYNGTSLLRYPFMVRAGGNYHTPWTRDAAVNVWQAVRFLEPEAARSTLLAVCTLNASGEIIIQPDVQVWDQIIWSVGAWSYILATGDDEFASLALGVIGRALGSLREVRFNSEHGLFRGGSFFNDGISGYPIECHEKNSSDSFAPAHAPVEEIMCLSTNCLYCEAYRIHGELASRFGDEKKAEQSRKYSRELKSRINSLFFSDSLGRYRYILFPDGHTDDSQELSGHIFSVLFDICPQERQAELLKNLIISEKGAVSLWPPFEGLYSESRPGRHNNLIWPFLNGMLIQAACKCSLHSLAGDELRRMNALFTGSDLGLYEIYSPYTGKAFGGWQTGRIWDSCRDQTWSASCYVGALIHGIFGVNVTAKGVLFTPCVPEFMKDSALKGLRICGIELEISIKGYGTKLSRFILDGKEGEAFIPQDNKSHRVEIILTTH